MSLLPWLDGYTGQTTDELLALEDAYRADSIATAFAEALDRKAARIGTTGLSGPELAVASIEALERDVNNDGFDGFFRWSPGCVEHVVAALEAIGAVQVADLARRAIATLGVHGPPTAGAVTAALDRDDAERDDRLEACDRAYYDLGLDLATPLLAYIRANRTEITLP